MEDQLRSFRRYSRVFPSVPYARHVPRVGCSIVANGKPSTQSPSSKSHHHSSAVKILALLCSKQAHSEDSALSNLSVVPARKRARSEEDANADADKHAAGSSLANAVTSQDKMDAETSLPAKLPQQSHGDVRESHSLALEPTASAATTPVESQPSSKSHLYVRVQYDRALITTLPIEIMRKQHPQVLIDYLLSMSVWA